VGPLVLREGCPYVGQTWEVHPRFGEQAARLAIETGRPVAHVVAEISVGEQVLGRWVHLARQAAFGKRAAAFFVSEPDESGGVAVTYLMAASQNPYGRVTETRAAMCDGETDLLVRAEDPVVWPFAYARGVRRAVGVSTVV
jgi:hypothetical protein